MNSRAALRESKGISIFLRILVIFMAINFATSAIVIVVAYLFNSETIERRTRESVTQQVSGIRDTYQKQYGEVLKSAIRELAESEALDGYLTASDPIKLIVAQKVERTFVRALRNSPSLQSARFVDTDGRVAISVRGSTRVQESFNLKAPGASPPEGVDAESARRMSRIFMTLSTTPLLLSAGYMEHFIPPRETTIEGPFVGADGSASAVAGLAKLDLETLGFGGAMLVHQDLGEFFRYLRELRFFEQSTVWVFDAAGRVLLRPSAAAGTLDPTPALSPEFQSDVRLVDFKQGLVAYQDIANFPGKRFMRVAVSIPSALLTKDFNNAITFFSIVMLVSLAIVMLVSLYVSRYLSKPIVELSVAAARLAEGDLDAAVSVRTTGEVQTLVDSFNHMTTALRAANASRDGAMQELVNEVGERKRIELDLKQQARDLTEARTAAESASMAKSQFLSTMSHEIRTPLNGVLGMSELLQHTQLDVEQTRYADAIASAGRALHDLLSDVLDLAKIEEGKVQLERVDFEPLKTLFDIAQVYRELASTHGVLFTTAIEPGIELRVQGDPTRFRQVVSNLVGNAVKFTEKGTVELACRLLERSDAQGQTWLRVSVQDTGVGIAAEEIPRLFQPFVQADSSTTRKFGGTGLGLVICKYLVELMGGKIHVESALGQGSQFWFDLPFGLPSGDAPAGRHEIADKRLERAHVLVAEDNPINQQVVGALLRHLGVTVTVVENGDLAVKAVQREAFDLVLMDCQMPVQDGFEATARIRSLPEPLCSVPIVALTANALAGDQRRCLEAGMDDYVPKPVTGVKLADVLRRHLGMLRADVRPKDQSRSDGSHRVGPPATAAQELPSFDPTVIASLPMIADGSQPEFADEMLSLFEHTCAQSLKEMDASLRAGQLQALQRLLHTQKSSSAQVGASELSALFTQRERELRAGTPMQVEWSQQFDDAFQRFRHARQAWQRLQGVDPVIES